MNEACKALYKDCQDFFQRRLVSVQDLQQAVDPRDMVDIVYAIRESIQYIEAVEKLLQKLSDELQEATFTILLARGKKSISSDHATGTRHSKMNYPIPSRTREPEKYLQFMQVLGVPEDLVTKDIVRPHWPGIMDLCKELHEKGENAPEGIDPNKGTSQLRITVRKKKGVLE